MKTPVTKTPGKMSTRWRGWRGKGRTVPLEDGVVEGVGELELDEYLKNE